MDEQPEESQQSEYQDEHVEDAQSGVIRASVFGANDGLVSNLGLVMGVAAGSSNRSAVVLAGVAGLLAGAFSMAAGEYISMQTQREMFQRELDLEREHISRFPRQEQAHLTSLLVDNGLTPAVANRVAEQVHSNIGPAVQFHARFELGINPDSLGSPQGAAISSFLAFCLGAIIPLLPWFFTGRPAATLLSIACAALGLIVVGVLTTRYTTRSAWASSARQLAIGALSAGVTYVIGYLIGTSI